MWGAGFQANGPEVLEIKAGAPLAAVEEERPGQQLEVLLGHATFFGMLDRKILSVFSSVYKFVKAKHLVNCRLWNSCREEIFGLLGSYAARRQSEGPARADGGALLWLMPAR